MRGTLRGEGSTCSQLDQSEFEWFSEKSSHGYPGVEGS